MEWWLIPIGIAVVALLWFLWVAAFQSGETVSAMPELDGYVPGESDLARPRPDNAEQDLSAVDTSTDGPSTDQAPDSDADETAQLGDADAGESDVDDGTWIEIDIEPLFASSQSRQIIELTDAEDTDGTP